jgi:hypothetical protein
VNVLLDTDVVIEIQRGNDRTILAKWEHLLGSGILVFYSPVVSAEVWAGARPREHLLIQYFFDALSCLTVDAETGKLAGDLTRRFGKSHSLEIPDALIAATAIQHDASLWTRNRKHYPMPELSLLQ